MGELERLLEPNYTDRLTLSDDAKAEIILAGSVLSGRIVVIGKHKRTPIVYSSAIPPGIKRSVYA